MSKRNYVITGCLLCAHILTVCVYVTKSQLTAQTAHNLTEYYKQLQNCMVYSQKEFNGHHHIRQQLKND